MPLALFLIISVFAITGCGSGGSGDGGNSETSVSSSESPVSSAGDSGNNDGNNSASDNNNEPGSDSEFSEQMLYAVNQARAQARDCGGEWMPAVEALTWDYALEQAAFLHSSDMANYDFFSHTSLNGDEPWDRVSAQGYDWTAVGENIAAGQKDIDSVMTAWLDSPGHCKNIMNSNFTQLGASSVTNSGSTYNIYWAQVFARPR